ncbi:MAG TPA: phage terminase small subunit [Sphingobium sp.]|nr:phage terminase small subunit [Sphingobium sp.]
MSLARRHRDRLNASRTVAAAPNDGAAPAPAVSSPAAGAGNSSPAARAAAQMALRLTHDLRRLKEIKGIAAKIAAKRKMLPEYVAWVKGILEADAGVGTGTAADVLPTMMVWLIDIGDYEDALDLLPFLLRHKVAMPGRYNRDPATVAVEEIATAALKAQAAGQTFRLGTLYRVAELTDGIDMHDEPRAKLLKALGTEELRHAEEDEASAEGRPLIETALASLIGAQGLHDRIGVKDKIKRAQKLLAANLAAFPPASPEQGGPAA